MVDFRMSRNFLISGNSRPWGLLQSHLQNIIFSGQFTVDIAAFDFRQLLDGDARMDVDFPYNIKEPS
jgi:hypothetical protein